MRAIVPSLWFDGNLEEAAEFYVSVFGGSALESEYRQGDGTLVSAEFTVAGYRFAAINGGPQFPFTEAVSFVVECDSQEEVDHYWAALLADGGTESQCGWLKDRFGLSWQIVPAQFLDLMRSPDKAAVQRAVDVMLTQRKLELEPLLAAFRG